MSKNQQQNPFARPKPMNLAMDPMDALWHGLFYLGGSFLLAFMIKFGL